MLKKQIRFIKIYVGQGIPQVQQLQQKAIPVQHSCRVLEVSRAGYYAAQRRVRRSATVCEASLRLQSAFEASGRSYGSRHLQGALNGLGIRIGRYRMRRLIPAYQLKPVWKRKFIHTTDSKHNLLVFDNVLDRQFTPITANQAWVSDITYIRAPVAAGSIWPPCWTCIRARSLAVGDGTFDASRTGVCGLANGLLAP